MGTSNSRIEISRFTDISRPEVHIAHALINFILGYLSTKWKDFCIRVNVLKGGDLRRFFVAMVTRPEIQRVQSKNKNKIYYLCKICLTQQTSNDDEKKDN